MSSQPSQPSQPTKPRDSRAYAHARARAARAGVPRPAASPAVQLATVEKLIMPPWEWIPENVIDPTSVNLSGNDFSNARLLRLAGYQTRILKAIFTPDSNGVYPYSTVLWSQPKKSGKTQLAGGVGAWFADQIEAPNEVLTLANDQEQSAGRIFSAMTPTFHKLGARVPTAPTSKPEVRLPNGTRVAAIPNNYAGAAGGNYGLTLWSELWGYTTERSRRLYDELVPVPTRRNSIRWIETYAGFEDESELLLKLFLRIFTDTTEQHTQPKARPVPGLEDITTEGRPACWHIPEERLFVFVDHEYRMPWQRGEYWDTYLTAQAADLTESAFVRLWQNRWQKSVGEFIPSEWWRRSLKLSGEQFIPMTFAIDASVRHATSAIVGVRRITREWAGLTFDRYQTGYCRVFDPLTYGSKADSDNVALGGKKGDLDLEELMATEVEKLADLGLIVGPVWYDPFQFHSIAMNLRAKKIPCAEFPQNNERMLADTFLYQQYKHGTIDNYPHRGLESHVGAAKAKENDKQQIRIIKGTATGVLSGGANDAAIAQSMSVWKSSLRSRRKKRRRSSSSSTFS